MINQSIRNIALSGLMTLLVIGLVVHLAGQTVTPALAQEGGTATSTPEVSPSATTTSEICTEDPDTGELTCTEREVPVGVIEIIDESSDVSGQNGVSGQGCYTDEVSGITTCTEELLIENNRTPVQVPNSGSFTLVGKYLHPNYNYKLEVSRPSGNDAIGFGGNCLSSSDTISVPSQSGTFVYTHNFTVATCSAANTVITVKLLKNGWPEITKIWTLTTTAAPPTTPGLTPPPPTPAVPTPTTPSTSNPAIPPTPDAPTDVRGHWDVNLAPGTRSGRDEYGYFARFTGAVSDDTFDYEDVTYTVLSFRWDESQGKIELGLDKCLKPSAFSKLWVGDLEFTKFNGRRYTDSRCEDHHAGRRQKFEFDVSTNPLPIGSPVRVTLLLKLPEPFVITADPEFPSDGQYVNLTVPDYGTRYQWQRWSGGQWTDLGSRTTSPKKRVSFSTQGTRKFRVIVNPGTTSEVESPPIHVTWDIWNVGLGLVTSVSKSVATSTDYTTAQSSLLTCVNSGRAATSTYASFDDVLADYTGTTMTRMESGGNCHTQADTMFSTYQRLTKSALDSLNTSTSEYYLFLESEEGSELSAELGNAEELRNLAIYASADLLSPGALEAPFYVSKSGEGDGPGGQADTLPDSILMGEGLDCLPSILDGDKLTLVNKLSVLNCLVFSTRHSFWVDQASNSVPPSERLRNHPRYVNWLQSKDWECTGPGAFEGPVPACWKHDFAVNGLQRFAGEAGEDSWGDELDITWNPRNKALADLRFKADILKYGCQAQPLIASPLCAPFLRSQLAASFHWGVAEFNDKGWPVISKDIQGFSTQAADLPGQDALINRLGFQRCTEPVFPEINDSRVVTSGDTVTLSWNFQAGCTAELSDIGFNATWYIKPPVLLYFAPVEDHTTGSCTATGDRISCTYDFSRWESGAVIKHVELKIVPANKEYGGEEYRRDQMYVGHKLR